MSLIIEDSRQIHLSKNIINGLKCSLESWLCEKLWQRVVEVFDEYCVSVSVGLIRKLAKYGVRTHTRRWLAQEEILTSERRSENNREAPRYWHKQTLRLPTSVCRLRRMQINYNYYVEVCLKFTNQRLLTLLLDDSLALTLSKKISALIAALTSEATRSSVIFNIEMP